MQKMKAQFPDFIYQFPKITLPPGVEGNSNLLDAPQGQAVFHTIPKGQQIPLHTHKDSFSVLLSGHLEFTMGNDIQERVGPTFWFIPEDVPHKGNALADSLLIEFFCEKRFQSGVE